MRPFVLAVVLSLVPLAALHAGEPATQAGSEEGTFSVRSFGAAGDGKTDDTAAIQKAIDAATQRGGVVLLPPGRYLVAGHLKVHKGVAIRGVNQAPHGNNAPLGTVVLATGGRDKEDAPPLFHLGHSSAVVGLTVWYPEQKPTDIRPYPWTFQMEGYDNTIENVTLINSFNGVRTGPANNVRHRIRSLYGCTLRRGIFVDNCTDIGRVENCQLHCHWWSKELGGDWDPTFKFMVENLEAFTFGRTDWEYVTNNFVFPAKVGYRFIATQHGACNGHLTGCGADACETSLRVEAIQPMGLLITGGQFVAFTGKEPVQIRIEEGCGGSVRFVNCAFWGPAWHNAILRGPGFTSFSDCYFSNWNEKTPENPLVVARAGRLQINNSTFATTQPSVLLEEGVRHAIVQGNNGARGVSVIDRTGGRAILANNEPGQVTSRPAQ